MNCIKCFGKSKVTTSRNSMDPINKRFIPSRYYTLPSPFIFRNHKCDDCGFNFQSIELPAYRMIEKLEAIEADIKVNVKEKITQLINEF